MMFPIFKNQTITTIQHILASSEGGIYKRIDENRELLELLQKHAPVFLRKYSWINGWLQSQDKFLNDLSGAVKVDEPFFKPSQDFPRTWPKTECQEMNVMVDLTERGTEKFEAWFAAIAKSELLCGAAEAEMCLLLADRLLAAETLEYELDGEYTLSGRSQSITLDHSDLSISEFPAGDPGLIELNHQELLIYCRNQIATGERKAAVQNYRAVTGVSLVEAHRLLAT